MNSKLWILCLLQLFCPSSSEDMSINSNSFRMPVSSQEFTRNLNDNQLQNSNPATMLQNKEASLPDISNKDNKAEQTIQSPINTSCKTSETNYENPQNITSNSEHTDKANDNSLHGLKKLLQQLYVAQAQVQLEALEIQRAQTVAATAQQLLEDSANNVRVITAALHSAQQTVAASAMRAQTAQLQLAAHDQLLFAARQRVDALSGQMVALQAEEGIIIPKAPGVDISALLKKLGEPLPANETPKPVPSILNCLYNQDNLFSDDQTAFSSELNRMKKELDNSEYIGTVGYNNWNINARDYGKVNKKFLNGNINLNSGNENKIDYLNPEVTATLTDEEIKSLRRVLGLHFSENLY